MSNLLTHAANEFKAAGWVDENGKFIDDMQEAICNHVLKLLEIFGDEGHSGMTAPYAIDMFSRLAKFEPIAPLTGEDSEWTDIGFGPDMRYQNNRFSRVFKGEDGQAYDSGGRVFWEWATDSEGKKYKSYFTGRSSRVNITFPYVPNVEYVEATDGN